MIRSNRHMPQGKIVNAFAVLACTNCQWRAWVQARGDDSWNGNCPRCGNDTFRFIRMAVATTQSDYALIAAEAQADAAMINEDASPAKACSNSSCEICGAPTPHAKTDPYDAYHGVPR